VCKATHPRLELQLLRGNLAQQHGQVDQQSGQPLPHILVGRGSTASIAIQQRIALQVGK